MQRLPALLASLLLVACAGGPEGAPDRPADDSPGTRVELDEEGRLSYVGPLTAEANTRALEIFEAARVEPRTLLITSGGGSIEAGLDLAEWILEEGLDVEVGGYCLSSCANYVFLAGDRKKLREGSVVFWHGSAWQESFDDLVDPNRPDFQPSLLEARRREVRFFDRIGVDNVITVYGQGGFRISAIFRWLMRRPTLGFDYSLEDLERMGVRGVVLVDGTWEWREHRPEYERRVRRVSLDDDYEFTQSRFAGRLPPER